MSISRRICKSVVLIGFFMGGCAAAAAQQRHLYNDTSLYGVYALMQQSGDTVVSVLHVGDSHVQGGFYPDAVRKPLQEKFGDAGPGWVFPYNLAGTNGTDRYRWSSNVRWNDERMVERNVSRWPGIGGIAISRPEGPAQLVYTGQPVKKITYWFEGRSMRPDDKGSDVFEDEQEKDIRRAELTNDSAQNVVRASFSFIGRFYGAVAESGEPGILYHAIGINGAQFSHYNQFGGRIIASQMDWLKPRLVIISLGTNEAFGGVSAAQLRQEIEKMTGVMKDMDPEVRFLFTTPPSGMMKKRQVPYKKKGKKRTYYRVSYVKVPQANTLRDAMITICQENGWAYWDLFAAMKADARFARAWSGDRVHFNAYGYTLQGQLLAEAILASFEQWKKQNVKP